MRITIGAPVTVAHDDLERAARFAAEQNRERREIGLVADMSERVYEAGIAYGVVVVVVADDVESTLYACSPGNTMLNCSRARRSISAGVWSCCLLADQLLVLRLQHLHGVPGVADLTLLGEIRTGGNTNRNMMAISASVPTAIRVGRSQLARRIPDGC